MVNAAIHTAAAVEAVKELALMHLARDSPTRQPHCQIRRLRGLLPNSCCERVHPAL
jgi:hypothetical protein